MLTINQVPRFQDFERNNTFWSNYLIYPEPSKKTFPLYKKANTKKGHKISKSSFSLWGLFWEQTVSKSNSSPGDILIVN